MLLVLLALEPEVLSLDEPEVPPPGAVVLPVLPDDVPLPPMVEVSLPLEGWLAPVRGPCTIAPPLAPSVPVVVAPCPVVADGAVVPCPVTGAGVLRPVDAAALLLVVAVLLAACA